MELIIKRLRINKLYFFIGFVLSVFLVFLYFYFRPRDYEIKYYVNDIEVVEKFIKSKKVYYFVIDKKYDFIKEEKYSNSRKHITKIDQSNNCITPYFKNEMVTKLCYDNCYQSISVKNQDIKKSSYKGINVYDYNNIYAIWNYKSVILLDKGSNKEVRLLSKDSYDNGLTILINNLLIMPNYDDLEYTSFIIFDIKTSKFHIWKIDYEISSDSYILGSYEKSFYLVDRKNSIEYEVNPFKEKISIVGSKNKTGKIYKNGFESININKLTSSNEKFEEDVNYNYYLEDGLLILRYLDFSLKTKIAEINKGDIVSIYKDKVYYLNDGKLYMFSPLKGNRLLLEYFEWNFNYQNQIYVYNR